jgi:hypothetical protein
MADHLDFKPSTTKKREREKERISVIEDKVKLKKYYIQTVINFF